MDRLLFVDDEPFVLQALRRTFEGEGYEVVTAGRPREALEILRGQEFQVVGADYRMPEMTGAQFLAEARVIAPQSYRILISAVEEFNAAVDAVNRGEIYRFVPKPWSRDELVAAVRSAAEDWHLRRRYAELTALVHGKNAQLEALNHELERQVQDRTSHLLDGMIAALDYRDTETQWHSRRVSRYARRIAEQLGVTGQALWDIEQGALLHDIGKIGVRDAILLKPAKLTPEEWVEMKRHPELGYRLLRHIPYLAGAREIVLAHQERFDGQGYPRGLSGEAIVLGARIFHVADTYDAITSDRPYRKARPYAVAREEIVRFRGTQFDPRVVDAFCAIPERDFAAIQAQIELLAAEETRAEEEDVRRAMGEARPR